MIRAPRFWWGTPGAAAGLLAPFASLYGNIAARRLAQTGERIGIPVICVGNPTVGGSGKTPAAVAIARMLIAAGERPVFLTRGYGGRLAGPVAVEPAHTAMQVGDEAPLLARIAPTIVAENRVSGARLAGENGASVVVMDDGFQNPSLAKDLAILVINGTRGIGNSRVLPAGPLRAPLEPQLDRAHAILIVGAITGAAPLVSAARARGLPLFHARLEPEEAAVAALADTKVLAFAGIGDPEKFFATVAAAGIEAPVLRGFADHRRYTRRDASALIVEAARNGLQLLTTEKDLVRLRGDPNVPHLAHAARALPVALKVAEEGAFKSLVMGALPR
jgi:tetraacyldisaccharide 4'-kinase